MIRLNRPFITGYGTTNISFLLHEYDSIFYYLITFKILKKTDNKAVEPIFIMYNLNLQVHVN